MKRIVQRALGQLGFGLTKIRKITDERGLYAGLFPRSSLDRKAFYNISFGGHFGFGCNFSHPLWTNVDVDRLYPPGWPQYDPLKDIAYDPFADDRIPLEDASAELFHSRFSFEHVPDGHARVAMREIRRCLKPAGVFHVVVPNLEFDYLAYHRGDRSYFNWIDNFSRPEMMDLMRYGIPMREMGIEQVFLTHFAANASPHHLDGAPNRISDGEFREIMLGNPFEKAMDLCTSRCCPEKQRSYRQNHVNWWTPHKMREFLAEAGFSRILHISAGQSVSPAMRDNPRFDSLWKEVSFVMEAIK